MSRDTEPQSITFTTTDGVAINGEIAGPIDASLGVVCTHPHPLYGGDRHNPVVEGLFQTAVGLGCRTIRFDFRGSGRSGGEHSGGDRERLDVEAAIEEVIGNGRPIVLAGYSFGADVVMAVDHPSVIGWFAVAPPLMIGEPATYAAASDHRPAWLAVPEHDQYRSPESARGAISAWQRTAMNVVPMADHFMAGATARVSELFSAAIGELRDQSRRS